MLPLPLLGAQVPARIPSHVPVHLGPESRQDDVADRLLRRRLERPARHLR